MEVYPLSVPQINWETYISTFQNSFGRSPSNGLDTAGLKLESPASFIATLNFENITSPMDVLRNAARDMLLFHSFCSFIYIGDRDVLTSIPMQLLHVKYRRIKRDEYYAIISANMSHWRDATISATNPRSQDLNMQDLDTQEFFTIVYNYLCQAGYKEIWTKYTITYNNYLLYME